jgi:3D (Asp-Asp-Asp) domain-containing protein
MRQILENLKKAAALSQTAIQKLERHLIDTYPHLSVAERDRVVRQYLEKQLEVSISKFDSQYQPKIRQRLYDNIIAKPPGNVSGLDILKACLELNFTSESFYQELKKWLLSYPANRDLEVETTNLITLLRQIVRDYPEMTIEELIDTEQLFMDAAAQIINQNGAAWVEKDFGNMVPVDSVYFNSNLWGVSEDERAPRFQKGVAFATLAVAGFGLLLLSSISFLMASHHADQDDRKAKAVKVVAAQQTPSAVALPEVKKEKKPVPGLKIARNNYVVNNRIKRAAIVSRSSKQGKTRNVVNKQSNVVTNVSIKAPKTTKTEQMSGRAALAPSSGKKAVKAQTAVKAQATPENQTIIVGYTEIYNGFTATKIPLIKRFINKLKLKATTQAAPRATAVEVAETANDTATDPAGVSVKNKVVTVDPKVIPAGSSVYIKYPSGSGDLNGIYTTEAVVESSDNAGQSKIVLEEDSGVTGTTDTGNEVEVYVLDEGK